MSEIEEILMCDCGEHGLVISDYKEKSDVGVKFHEIYLAMFAWRGYHRPLDFGDRLRWIWRILTTGQPWADDLCLQPKDAKKLGKRLLELTKEDADE